MITRNTNLALYAFFALFCFSQGAIGSNNTTVNNQSTRHFNLSSADIRTYQPGDLIRYKSSVAGSGAAMTGDLTQSINNTVINPAGKQCLEHTVSTTYHGVGGPVPLTIRLLYYQDQQHSLYECGHFDNKTSSYVFITDTTNTPGGLALSIESPMKVGNTTSTLISYTDGTWKDCTRSVQSIEEVNTTVGVFDAYKITESCSNNADNSKTDTVSWFVPGIYTVKESGTGEFIAGDFILDSFTFD